jgi:protein-L-isoaspartate(D-aspartate) O-methyltransferase
MPAPLEHARRAFADTLRQMVGLRSAALFDAFASVPREQFVGPGPWQIIVAPDWFTYRDTPDADPRHLYANVLVALDASRKLNNGEPAALARWLDALDLSPGKRMLHVGCGVGYYTAICAEAVSPGGSVVGVEIDPALAARARRNLVGYAHVEVACDDGSARAGDSFDVIFVNAGATQVEPVWSEQLRMGGRLLVPLTVDVPEIGSGFGGMLLVTRRPGGDEARFLSPVGIFHCAGARNAESNALLGKAYAQGDGETVRSLRWDAHEAGAHCWLHGRGSCLSRLPVDGGSTSSGST